MSFDVERFREFGLTDGEKHFQRLANAVERGELPPADTLQFLAQAGREILNQVNPKKALKLEKPQGRKKDSGLIVCRRIMLVQIICGLMDEHGFTKEQAIDRLTDIMAGKKGFSRDSIERHYDAYQRLARENNATERKFNALLERPKDPQKLISFLEIQPVSVCGINSWLLDDLRSAPWNHYLDCPKSSDAPG